ncbi:MAG: 2'-deoxycytidine 5'-triphosphate deaminase domain-containing protein, partial [Geminicoccaceae bacterium]
MNTARETLFAGEKSDDSAAALRQGGILPGQQLQALIDEGRAIRPSEPLAPGQIQPASLDLRL